jgi:PST family polysaccharide transporter
MDNLKERAIRGGAAKLFGQGVSLVIRVGSLAVLARLLSPGDFGIVAMMTVLTGLFEILATAGLSPAMVQSATITDQQRANLFWINLACGAVLAALCIGAGSPIASFYGEPRLIWVAPAFAVIFLMNSLGGQQSALLERQLRYLTLTTIEVAAQFLNAAVAIVFAFLGAGYWSLIFGLIAQSTAQTTAFWIATGWIPGPPQRNAPVGPLLRFGATVTLNSLIVFLAYNLEKILIGKVWGAAALGVYGRAYQLVNLPTASINTAITGVALSSLSRLQDDPTRQRRYFLKGYTLLMSLTMPLTIGCALFGNDIILVMLGSQWTEAAPVFRLLTPMVLVFGMINPLWPLLLSAGKQGRSLYLAMVLSPLMIVAAVIGIPYGPTGVATAFSTTMTLWLVPHVYWCLNGMAVSPRDLAVAAGKPLLAAVSAGVLASVVYHQLLLGLEVPLVRLALSAGIMATAYFGILLFILGERRMYLDVLHGSRPVAWSKQ